MRGYPPLKQGEQFSRLTVIDPTSVITKHGAKVLCQCTCGTQKLIYEWRLKSGRTKSCGCLEKEVIAERFGTRIHGLRGTPEYSIWCGMKQRCNGTDKKSAKYYFDRGIKVCERWMNVENFVQDMGPRPSKKHSIERINNDGDYEPSNCKWATYAEQNANKRPRRAPRCGLPDHLKGANRYVSPTGKAWCRACNVVASREYKERKLKP